MKRTNASLINQLAFALHDASISCNLKKYLTEAEIYSLLSDYHDHLIATKQLKPWNPATDTAL